MMLIPCCNAFVLFCIFAEYREICKTKSQNLSTVEVILAVVGGCAGVIILMLVFFYFMRKRKQKREKENMAEVCGAFFKVRCETFVIF